MIGYRIMLLLGLGAFCLACPAVGLAELPAEQAASASSDSETRSAAPMGDVRRDPAVRGVQYVAEHPNPGEPLGFSASHFEQGAAFDPSYDPGILSQAVVQEEEFYDPADPDAPAPAVSSGEWFRNGCWYAEQSATYLSRSTNIKNSKRVATKVTLINPSQQRFLTIPIDMTFQPGIRSTIGKFLGRDSRNRDHALEFTFLGLSHWHQGVSLSSADFDIFSNLDPTLSLPAFNQSNFQQVTQTSDFNSWELNYKIERRLPRDQMVYTRDSTWVRQGTAAMLPTVFGGLRVVTINDGLHYIATAAAANGFYDVGTRNNLVGFQGGGEWFYEAGEWRFGGRLKGGGFVNWSQEVSLVRTISVANGQMLGPQNRDERVTHHDLSFLGEISFIGGYQIAPKIALRASYDLMFITDLALAQNQLTFQPTTPLGISNHHGLFLQGVSFGIDWVR